MRSVCTKNFGIMSMDIHLEGGNNQDDEYYCTIIETTDALLSLIQNESTNCKNMVDALIVIIYKTMGFSQNPYVS